MKQKFITILSFAVLLTFLTINIQAQDYPPVVINEYVTNANGDMEAIELLVIQDKYSLVGKWIKDFSDNNNADEGGGFQFKDVVTWRSVRAGTLIVLRNSAEDVGTLNEAMVVGLKNPDYFVWSDYTYPNAEFINQEIAVMHESRRSFNLFGWRFFILLNAMSDEIIGTSNDYAIRDINFHRYDPNSHFISFSWQELYKCIYKANDLLAYMPGTDIINSELKAEFEAEAYFDRALCYFYLVNLWGNVPLITESIPVGEHPIMINSTETDIYNHIISDLTNAINGLPEDIDTEEIGQPTKFAAMAMLAKTYLYRATKSAGSASDYSEAISLFEIIINSGKYSLASSFEDNFNLMEFNEESIFEIEFGESYWASDWTPGPSENRSWLSPSSWIPVTTSPFNWSTMNTSVIPVGLFDEASDIRRFVSIYKDGDEIPTKYFDHNNASSTWIAFTSGREAAEYGIRKFDNEPSLTPNNMYSPINLRLIRYADILLMAAEAYIETGNLTQALSYINQVRSRANITSLSAGLTTEELRGELRNERIRELCFEGHRILDILRWGIADEVFNQEPEDSFESYKVVLPIPQAALELNPGLNQNAGY